MKKYYFSLPITFDNQEIRIISEQFKLNEGF